jgi:hypothetical protein
MPWFKIACPMAFGEAETAVFGCQSVISHIYDSSIFASFLTSKQNNQNSAALLLQGFKDPVFRTPCPYPYPMVDR